MPREIRETLDRKIEDHFAVITELGGIVEQAILGSVAALQQRDLELARKIYNNDQVINKKRYELEASALITVATQQPMAIDLRILASILDIAGELERIGDYAKGIARIAMRLGDQKPLQQLVHLSKMAELTADMLGRAIGAFVELDEKTALSIPKEDDQIDVLYNKVYHCWI